MSLTSIDIGLAELLADSKRRQIFFRVVTQDEIASRIKELRKERGLNQTEFAAKADMKQSAVSRIEQADYAAWNLSTLFRVADALDARIRVTIEKSEDAVLEYLATVNDDLEMPTGVQKRALFAEEKGASLAGKAITPTNPTEQRPAAVTNTQSPLQQPRVGDRNTSMLSNFKVLRTDPGVQAWSAA